MAWRSSGATNDEMVDNLRRFSVISSSIVERGFRNVDRSHFVPPGSEDIAHSDQPLKEGNIHISAPHVYGSALEALELCPNTSHSFLNVGSGTGYVSCIVASILGHMSMNYGVEIHKDVVQHSQRCIAKWKSSISTKDTPHIHIVHGNALNIVPDKGEAIIGFDRIYIGAAVDRSHLPNITRLLKPGGVLVGPAGDELVKIVRIGRDSNKTNEFSEHILSGVRFAPLLTNPSLPTILPSNVWEPSMHQTFPESFRRASKTLLMCGNAEYVQPPPEMPPKDQVNVAATLPSALWLEILSFAHRDWFETRQTNEAFLRQRLMEEQENTRRAQEARREAESRLEAVERERDIYCLLARRWHSRLQLLSQNNQRTNNNGEDQQSVLLTGREQAVILGLGTMFGGFHSDSDDNVGDDDEEEYAAMEEEEEDEDEEFDETNELGETTRNRSESFRFSSGRGDDDDDLIPDLQGSSLSLMDASASLSGPAPAIISNGGVNVST